MPAGPHILGISAYYHDSAAALLCGGDIVAAAQEERFSRRKNDERFPAQALAFCLRHARLSPSQLDAVVFYDKPILKFGRMLESWLAVAPGGWTVFPRVLPGWLGEKLDLLAGYVKSTAAENESLHAYLDETGTRDEFESFRARRDLGA